MLLHRRYMTGTVALGALLCSSGVSSMQPRSAVLPFDGQYLSANASNTVVEWWYIQSLAEPVGTIPPANAVAVFTEGQLIGTEPAGEAGLPEFYIMLSGTFSNGTNFFYTIPATAANVAVDGQAVTGVWPGAGNFTVNNNLTTTVATIDVPSMDISGTISLTSNGAHHYPCGSAADPYFDSAVPAGVSLNSYEEIVFKQFGWAITMTGGSATVDLTIEGTPLQFSGNAYHDHNFMPTAINEFFNYWYWVQAQVGPYDLTGMLLAPLDSQYAVVSGYLYESGTQTVLQDQCSLNGTKTVDAATIVPWGTRAEPATGAVVPAGFTVGFTLADGSEYSFNLTAISTNPALAEYYRWTGVATGGEVGGEQYSGTALFEWMDPSLSTYGS